MYSRIFIVVDALDECKESSGCRARFISELLYLQESNGANIFATSRFIPDIMDKLKGSSEVEIHAHDEDVRKYLESQVMQCGSALLKARCEEVTIEITKVVKGMFLLAQLHFETIKTQKTLKKFKNTLANLPTGQKAYDSAYEEAVRRIKGLDLESKELAWRVLSWITCAKRPLATKELQHALAVEISKTELDEENLVQIEDMVSVCAGLVTIDEESNIIRLVHYTTQEYFERTQKQWFPAAQTEITTICVTYLSFSAFETVWCKTDQEYEERLQLFPFFNYAAGNWGHHAPKDEASQKVTKFLKSQAKVEASSQALRVTKTELGDPARKITGLHLAGIFGLHKAANTLLELGHSPIAADAHERQPLWYAAQNGHEAVIRLLLAHGAIVNTLDTEGRSALSVAAENGHRGVVEKLLAEGADVNKISPNGPSALLAAARGGHQEIVEILLAQGANVEFYDSDFGTILSEAAENGHQEVVKKLLAAGANVNSVPRSHRVQALYWAAGSGHQEVVKILLAAGANVRSGGTDNALALSNAAENGHHEIVEILLAAGADVNASSFYNPSALSNAATIGHQEIVEILLAAGADVNSDKSELRALSQAAENGHQEIVEILLAAGADINANAGLSKQTALISAAEIGHWEIIKKLLAAGANVNAVNNYNSTALMEAAGKGYQEIVEKLLAVGADINAVSYSNAPALSSAVWDGHQEVVDILLAAGANVNAASGGRYNQSVLMEAAAKGYLKIVEKLLAAGADVNLIDGKGQTALGIAAEKGYQEIVEMLLAAGAQQ